jgi:two-component system nitrate/nitrite response regulator NarL
MLPALFLTRREHEIATLVATGATNKEIAHQLGVSSKTVRNILTKVFFKTGVRGRTELAVRIVKSNLSIGS